MTVGRGWGSGGDKGRYENRLGACDSAHPISNVCDTHVTPILTATCYL